VRRKIWTKSVLALGTAVALCAAVAQQGAAQAARIGGQAAAGGVRATTTARVRPASGDGSGDFIVRCFFNTNIAPQDPIEAPGNAHADHLHVFFGNLASGGAAGDGTAFPGIQSGDYSVTSDTMEQNGLSTPTNCQDNKDTAGYWIPAPYMVTAGSGTPTPWQNTNGCTTSCTATGSSPNFHERVYYIPRSSTDQEIPDGTIMVAGFPNGCQTVVGGHTPDSCTNPPTTSYPQDTNIVEYACGADTANTNHVATPISEWPYDCTHYVGIDQDDSYSDGEVAIVRFPDCWDGNTTGNFPAPNSPKNAQGLPTEMVPGYVAPWIVYNVWNKDYSMPARPVNDFAYPDSSGNCTQAPYTHRVVQLEQRIHLLTYGAGWGAPSSCVGDSNINWDSSANSESSSNATDAAPGGDGDGDANVKIGTSLWVPFDCKAVTAPDPSAGAATLSFACTNGGDPNCDVPLSSPTGCVGKGGTCYVGAYSPSTSQYGWETLHADYWQTWQEAQNTLDNPANGGFDTPSDAGTFGDLVEDCVSGTAANRCSEFVVTSQGLPKQVYGTGSGAP
jgi:hypothetical protein